MKLTNYELLSPHLVSGMRKKIVVKALPVNETHIVIFRCSAIKRRKISFETKLYPRRLLSAELQALVTYWAKKYFYESDTHHPRGIYSVRTMEWSYHTGRLISNETLNMEIEFKIRTVD